MNTWPNGIRRAMTQSEHEMWNASNYPGTRQMCDQCGEETGRCEEDSIYISDDVGPACESCCRSANKRNSDE
jgi:hypothetical protein